MITPSSPSPDPLPATRVRYRVVGLVILFGMGTYLDRVCISTLAPHIMADLGLDKVRMGYVFSAFVLACAIFEIPTARMADRRGTRVVLARIVTWWSLIALAVAATMLSLAGAWAVCMDVGREHTGTVGAAMNTAGQIGAMGCPLLVAYTLRWFGSWNITILVMGALFLIGAAVWRIIDPRKPVFASA